MSHTEVPSTSPQTPAGFAYRDADFAVIYRYRNGQWDDGKLVRDHSISLPLAATALFLGQAAFEGLKAFRGHDGTIRIFRPHAHAERLKATAARILAPEVPTALFVEAVSQVSRANADLVPSGASRGALYLRPLLFGTSAEVGLFAAQEFVFAVIAVPVGGYFDTASSGSIRARVADNWDRSAPHGMGSVKVAGNYAATLLPDREAKAEGFHTNLYVDARERRYVEEFSTANFIGITNQGTYVTPDSAMTLQSVTNASLMTLAGDMGMPVERRPVHLHEVESFAEIGACGTAVVLKPVEEIFGENRTLFRSKHSGFGPYLRQLHDTMVAIQFAETVDRHNWLHPVTP